MPKRCRGEPVKKFKVAAPRLRILVIVGFQPHMPISGAAQEDSSAPSSCNIGAWLSRAACQRTVMLMFCLS